MAVRETAVFTVSGLASFFSPRGYSLIIPLLTLMFCCSSRDTCSLTTFLQDVDTNLLKLNI